MPNKMDRLPAIFRHGADAALWDTSSGSDHSPENSAADLFDLVKSFIERDDLEIKEGENEDDSTEESDSFSCDSDAGVIKLQNLFGSLENKTDNDEIRIQAEQALKKIIGGRSFQFQGIKRQLMAHLRRKGFDAGEFEFLFRFKLNTI